MPKYVLAFTGGSIPETEEEQQRVMAAWGDWFTELGGAVVDQGNPFGAQAAVGGGATSGLTGYTILNADGLDDALQKAKSCPILEGGKGGVEVYEAIEM